MSLPQQTLDKIYDLYMGDRLTQSAVAKACGLPLSQVSSVLSSRGWKHGKAKGINSPLANKKLHRWLQINSGHHTVPEMAAITGFTKDSIYKLLKRNNYPHLAVRPRKAKGHVPAR